MKNVCRSHILILGLLLVSCSDNVGGNLGGYTVPVERVSLNKDSTAVLTNKEERLYVTFTPSDASNQSVAWTSSDETVASVDNKGVVSGKKPGSAEIRVTSAEGNRSAICTVTVSAEKTAVSGVTLNKSKLNIYASERETLFASVLPSSATDQTLVWKSNNTSIAEVSSGGLVTAKESGTATITVRTSDGHYVASCDVTVAPANDNPANPVEVTGISLNKTSLPIALGKTDNLVASVIPANAKNQNIIWVSDNPSIVDVSGTGVLTAKSAGYAIITVRSAEGSFSKQCEVFVCGSSFFSKTAAESAIVYITPGGIPSKMIVTQELAGLKFPSGYYDYAYNQKPVPDPFLIAETETTYALWKEVYDWATDYSRGDAQYVFSGKGINGGDDTQSPTFSDYPATCMTWRDAMVWCNALTEYYNAYRGTADMIECVYYSDPEFTNPIRVAYTGNYEKSINSEPGSFDKPYVKPSAKGFRLPYDAEWEFAARYIGRDLPDNRNILRVDGIYYTNGKSASGAKADTTDTLATSLMAVIWSDVESEPYNHVARVKTKRPNSLGLYDMSGNVEEHCFNWHSSTPDTRVTRGGSTLSSQLSFTAIQVGYEDCFSPYYKNEYAGFRIVRNK